MQIKITNYERNLIMQAVRARRVELQNRTKEAGPNFDYWTPQIEALEKLYIKVYEALEV